MARAKAATKAKHDAVNQCEKLEVSTNQSQPLSSLVDFVVFLLVIVSDVYENRHLNFP